MYFNILYIDLGISENIDLDAKIPIPGFEGVFHTSSYLVKDGYNNVIKVTPAHMIALDTYDRSSLLVIEAENYDFIKDDITSLKAKHPSSILPIVLVLHSFPKNLETLIELAEQDIFVFANKDSIWNRIHLIIQPILNEDQLSDAIKHGCYAYKKLNYLENLKAKLPTKMESAKKSAHLEENTEENTEAIWLKDRKPPVNPGNVGGLYNSSQNNPPQPSSDQPTTISQSWCKLI